MKGNFILIFNLNKLETFAGDNDVKLIWLLYKWYRDKDCIPRKGDKFVLIKPLTGGSSFLTNPEPLLLDKITDPIYIAQYIKLAGRRDLFMYKQYRVTQLDISFFPDINLENIKYNPLIQVSGNKIHFKYE